MFRITFDAENVLQHKMARKATLRCQQKYVIVHLFFFVYLGYASDMKKALIVSGIGIFCLAGLLFLFFKLRSDEQMAFPKTPHGQFIQNPIIMTDESTRIISWTLPVQCNRASYEFQEEGYKPNSNMLWGGGEKAICAAEREGYRCRADLHPEMKENDKQWIIQASAYDCADKNYYISEATISKF
jgi:hypothetical protein